LYPMWAGSIIFVSSGYRGRRGPEVENTAI
jgi:hypothetical protein